MWRDALARAEDLPVRALVKDEALVAISRKKKLGTGDLADVKFFPRSIAQDHGEAVIAAWREGREEGKGLPKKQPQPAEVPPSHKFAATQPARALRRRLPRPGARPGPRLPAVGRARFGRAGCCGATAGRTRWVGGGGVLTGWREEACGAMLRDLLSGQSIAVRWDAGG